MPRGDRRILSPKTKAQSIFQKIFCHNPVLNSFPELPAMSKHFAGWLHEDKIAPTKPSFEGLCGAIAEE